MTIHKKINNVVITVILITMFEIMGQNSLAKNLIVPMHTWISNCLFEAQEIHGKKDFVELEKFINSELINYLDELFSK